MVHTVRCSRPSRAPTSRRSMADNAICAAVNAARAAGPAWRPARSATAAAAREAVPADGPQRARSSTRAALPASGRPGRRALPGGARRRRPGRRARRGRATRRPRSGARQHRHPGHAPQQPVGLGQVGGDRRHDPGRRRRRQGTATAASRAARMASGAGSAAVGTGHDGDDPAHGRSGYRPVIAPAGSSALFARPRSTAPTSSLATASASSWEAASTITARAARSHWPAPGPDRWPRGALGPPPRARRCARRRPAPTPPPVR